MTSLVKKIDQRCDEAADKLAGGRQPGTFIIYSNNAKGLDEQLRGLAEKEALKRVSLCIGAFPARYEVSEEAEVTVVIYRQGTVVANFALLKGELDETKRDAIVESLLTVLPK